MHVPTIAAGGVCEMTQTVTSGRYDLSAQAWAGTVITGKPRERGLARARFPLRAPGGPAPGRPNPVTKAMRAVAGLITGAQIDRPGLSPVCLNKILSPALRRVRVRLDEVNGKGPPGLCLISFMFAHGS
jgi:hypothetical protein